MHFSKIFFLLATTSLITLSSCSTFSKADIRKSLVDIEKNKISDLNGKYTYDFSKDYQAEFIEVFDKLRPEESWQTNAYDFSLNNDADSRLLFMPNVNNDNEYLVELNLESDKALRISVLENSSEIMSTLVKGKLKRGMFYLDENFQECNGIPYLFGGCRTNRRRIGLTQSGDLLINRAVNDDGAVLFVFRNGYHYNLSYEYKRQK